MSASTHPPDALAEWLPPVGSDLYYALRFVPLAHRGPLTLLEAFRQLLTGLPLGCSNPDVARAKLAWWHGELHALDPARSQHALLRALAPHAATDPALVPALFAVVDGTAALLDQSRFEDVEARHACYARVHAPLWRVHARWAGVSDEQVCTAMAELGVAVELAYGLRDLRRLVDAGLAWVSRDREPAVPSATADAEWYAALAQREVPHLRATLDAARARLPTLGPHARVVLVRADLAGVLLDELAADGCRVWERRIELTPLRKLWRALRVRSAT